MALTNKHTVEFSNNRHTPTQHHPTGQNLAWGNFSNLPDPLRPLQLGDPSGGSRGTSSPDHVTAREAPGHSRGGPPGGPATVSCDRDSVSVPPCRANVENTTRAPPGCQIRVPRTLSPLGSPARLPARRLRRGGTRGRARAFPPRRDAEGAGRSTRSGPFVIVATGLLSRPRRPRRRPRASSSPGAGGRTARAAGPPARGRRPRSSP